MEYIRQISENFSTFVKLVKSFFTSVISILDFVSSIFKTLRFWLTSILTSLYGFVVDIMNWRLFWYIWSWFVDMAFFTWVPFVVYLSWFLLLVFVMIVVSFIFKLLRMSISYTIHKSRKD